METITSIFGEGEKLTVIQMSCRGVVTFLLALVLIRISGRRSFGMRSPLDNIIVILLGAILSREVVGASPFLPVVATCLSIVVLHRFCAWAMIKSNAIRRLLEGKKILLFQENHFVDANLDKGMVCREDVLREVRLTALTDDMNHIKEVYIENSGEISAIKK